VIEQLLVIYFYKIYYNKSTKD